MKIYVRIVVMMKKKIPLESFETSYRTLHQQCLEHINVLDVQKEKIESLLADNHRLMTTISALKRELIILGLKKNLCANM